MAEVHLTSRQALLVPISTGWVTVCNLCECVIVNPQAHEKVCPNREVPDGR